MVDDPAEVEKLLKELGEEKAELRRGTASLPPSDEAAQHLEQAFAWEDEDKYEKALEECDAALQLDPTLAGAHNLRGVILEELAREGEAVLAYREALRLDPDFDAARENLEAVEAELQAEEANRASHREYEATRREDTATEWVEEQVFFEGYDETNYYVWQLARLGLETAAGAITIYGYPHGKPTVTIPISEIANWEIVEREDIPRNLHLLAEGGDPGWGHSSGGGLLGLLLEGLDHVLAKSTKVPVIKLTQSKTVDSGRGWEIELRSKKRGRKGQAATLEMAQRIAAFLRHGGYDSAIPEELSVPRENLEALAKTHGRKASPFLLLGALFPILAYIVGIIVVGCIPGLSILSLSDYLNIVFRMYQIPTIICGLPGLALSLFLLWLASVTTQKEGQSRVIVVILICLCAIVTLAVGFGVGLLYIIG